MAYISFDILRDDGPDKSQSSAKYNGGGVIKQVLP